ncbi:hypothetical protein CTI12_AA252840 [Artemisia annua]|uniref:DUF4283 domain-containing protein n=1 Tax=Artemisia annua TaxID=35608 RepID=A0A2U1NKY5_ARTAN|nr:hypothetical protein CTI12_AA252840 [Artemisia annua]
MPIIIIHLCTLWIGRMHLHANVVRFERSPMYASRSSQPVNNAKPVATSFVSAVKGISVSPLPTKPALVIDDSCLVTRDLENFVMGEVLQFSSINNLRVLLSNEGFHNAHIVYLGGLWVMIELESSKAKSELMKHVGVASWFRSLCNAQSDFIAKERIVWVDIEGVPLHAWSRSTFYKIGFKWGKVVELEDGYDDIFARKRLCIMTNQEENILENFKIIVKGKVVHCSDDESIKGDAEINGEASNLNNGDAVSDSEVVSDTYFGDNTDEHGYENDKGQPSNAQEVSNNPFNIYDLLNKHNKDAGNSGTDTSIPYPPGFTPDKDTHVNNEHVVPDAVDVRSHSRSEWCNSRILEDAEKLDVCFSSEGRSNGVGRTYELKSKLSDIDKLLDQGRATEDILLSRMEAMKHLHDVQSSNNRDFMQKGKVRWAIEGDENSKFFHAIINKKRTNLSVKGVMVDGEWVDDPNRVKDEFRNHFAARFQDSGISRGSLNFTFPNRLTLDQLLASGSNKVVVQKKEDDQYHI